MIAIDWTIKIKTVQRFRSEYFIESSIIQPLVSFDGIVGNLCKTLFHKISVQ